MNERLSNMDNANERVGTPRELASVKTLSGLLDVPEKTIRGWVYRRQIPFVKVGGLVRFKIVDVRAWYNAASVNPTNPETIAGRLR